MSPFPIRLTFHGDLPFFLGSKVSTVERQLSEKTSVKDVIEACGVPHTEVDLILVNGGPVDFAFVIGGESAIDVYPVESGRVTSFAENRLQVRDIAKFVADGHLGKLVRDLRLLGVDVVYDPAAEDRQLVSISRDENRALLTRDRRLLMHAIVRHGYYLRSQDPLEQTLEVLRRFDLGSARAPFTRCLRCNAPLKPADKESVINQLEPLTRIYYEQFRRCCGCGQVYWSGSHFEKLQKRIETIRSRLTGDKTA
ncbi:MAG TPA: Mut7-C RNAse domain-containing protein [Chthoniobacterales bacterium]|nr:Mut7-C RNAse domain-containing protein [Chthoniobacterales bacterium]